METHNYSSMESRYKAMARHETNGKIFNWVEANSNGRCQNWKHRVNKMIKEVNIQYQSGDTNSTRIVRESDYSPASQLFLQGEKNNDRYYHRLSQARSHQY